jgi:hypothetical protein
MKPLKIFGWIVMGLAGVTAFGFVLGLAVMFLWNWLMPTIFGLPEITYWQSVGLFILCHLLFKGHHGPGGRDHGPPRWNRGRDRFADKVRGMVDEGCPQPQPRTAPTGDIRE